MFSNRLTQKEVANITSPKDNLPTYCTKGDNPHHISESLETIYWVKIIKFFDADPGWKKCGSGM
jgi:hypothetical protein